MQQDLAAGSLHVCVGQEAGSEAPIYAINDIYQRDETKAVLLVDGDSAFSSINRKGMLQNISITYPQIINNNIYCKLLYGTSQIICCRES